MTKQIPHEIVDRACEWFMEMRETTISDSKREAFADWLRSSPAHVQSYLEVAGMWGDASQVSKELSIELAGAAANVVALDGAGTGSSRFIGTVPAAQDTVPAAAPTRKPALARSTAAAAKRVPKRAHLAIAATVLLAIGAATWWQTTRPPTYTADTGEQRVITLDDGSIVRLNSQSKIRVRLTPHERNIELLEGQAHFQVAKDTARPFNVHTHDAIARAVGTQFDVYRRKTGTTVTVIEGRVALIRNSESEQPHSLSGATQQPTESTEPARPSSALHSQRSPSGTGTVLLAAGQQATITPTGAVQLEPQANIAAATGWLQQELIFTGEPLSVVIDEFNRYTRRTIVLDDPALAQFKINAAFNTTNPQSLLLFLSRMDGVTINETETEIHVTRREPQQ